MQPSQIIKREKRAYCYVLIAIISGIATFVLLFLGSKEADTTIANVLSFLGYFLAYFALAIVIFVIYECIRTKCFNKCRRNRNNSLITTTGRQNFEMDVIRRNLSSNDHGLQWENDNITAAVSQSGRDRTISHDIFNVPISSNVQAIINQASNSFDHSKHRYENIRFDKSNSCLSSKVSDISMKTSPIYLEYGFENDSSNERVKTKRSLNIDNNNSIPNPENSPRDVRYMRENVAYQNKKNFSNLNIANSNSFPNPENSPCDVRYMRENVAYQNKQPFSNLNTANNNSFPNPENSPCDVRYMRENVAYQNKHNLSKSQRNHNSDMKDANEQGLGVSSIGKIQRQFKTLHESHSQSFQKYRMDERKNCSLSDLKDTSPSNLKSYNNTAYGIAKDETDRLRSKTRIARSHLDLNETSACKMGVNDVKSTRAKSCEVLDPESGEVLRNENYNMTVEMNKIAQPRSLDLPKPFSSIYNHPRTEIPSQCTTSIRSQNSGRTKRLTESPNSVRPDPRRAPIRSSTEFNLDDQEENY